VIDFTRASDRQIAAAFRENDTLCGRFKPSQLDRDLIIPKEKNKFWIAASAAVITLLTIGNNKIFAQSPINTEQSESKTDDTKFTNPEIRAISGTVLDEVGFPLPSANVRIKNSDYEIQTDLDGLYSIEAKTGDTIVFKYVGTVTSEIVVAENNVYNITMRNSSYDYSNSSVGAITIRRTFFGRIFHSVGNIFR
jgi:hypothetical protein